jgi:4-oxalocrotonate tautomerase
MSGGVPDVQSDPEADDGHHSDEKEDSMALIQVTVIAGVFTTPQKEEIIERLTYAMAAIEGENMRQGIWCLVEEVASGDWCVGGRTLTADDVKALARAPTEPAQAATIDR